MYNQATKEIKELHQFFVDWYTAKVPDTTFKRCEKVLGPSFTIIDPNGNVLTREKIINYVRDSYGKKDESLSFNIWIEEVQHRWTNNGTHVLTYQEWQEEAGNRTARLSTVVFVENDQTPSGLEWVHVHETWLTRT